jgi:hypothetical protein
LPGNAKMTDRAYRTPGAGRHATDPGHSRAPR